MDEGFLEGVSVACQQRTTPHQVDLDTQRGGTRDVASGVTQKSPDGRASLADLEQSVEEPFEGCPGGLNID